MVERIKVGEESEDSGGHGEGNYQSWNTTKVDCLIFRTIQQPTRVNQHEGYLLVEDCPKELFPIKSVCEVEAWGGEREAENRQVCQRQHPRRKWNMMMGFLFMNIKGSRLSKYILFS